ncbi:MAG: hypothetical protein WD048_08675 [Chitinophagales bacterium]
MEQKNWITRFKEDFFGSSFKLAFRALFATAIVLLVTFIFWFLVSLPASYFFIQWFEDGMLIINDQPDFTDMDTSGGPWAVISEFFTFEFGDLGIYYLLLAVSWLFVTYLFFLGYVYQVVFKILDAKANNKPMQLIGFMLKSLNGKSIKVAVLLGIITLLTYIPALLVQSFAPYSFSLSFLANIIYYLLLIKFIISPVVYLLEDSKSILESLAYSWRNISWGSALKILIFSFGFIMLLVVLFIFAVIVFTGTSIAVPRFALPAFLFFMLMGIYLFTLAFSAQFGLYYRYLPIAEEVTPAENKEDEMEGNKDDQDDDFYFPEYDDPKN